ncbi:uncharacterized protein LJ264_012969 isoform 2-T2 [Porphyrio hochstetteri]
MMCSPITVSSSPRGEFSWLLVVGWKAFLLQLATAEGGSSQRKISSQLPTEESPSFPPRRREWPFRDQGKACVGKGVPLEMLKAFSAA